MIHNVLLKFLERASLMQRRYRCGNRNQMALLPKSIEDSVGADDPERVYDAFIEALDVKGLVYRFIETFTNKGNLKYVKIPLYYKENNLNLLYSKCQYFNETLY